MKFFLSIVTLLLLILATAQKKTALKNTNSKSDKPNILIICTDDVGIRNIGAYNYGMMVPTPNIDRIAKEGMLFTDHYAAVPCKPSRAMLITRQLPIRTGLTTVGMAVSPIGLSEKDQTLAEVLKPIGYRTVRFGKNHLGEHSKHLPTVYGFDESLVNLFNLNTDEEPFLTAWPKDTGFDNRYNPCGVLDCKVTTMVGQTIDGRFV